MRIASDPTPSAFNGPWTTAGRFLHRWPSAAALAAFVLFWLHRSQVYSGDGNQMERFIESGIWMVQSEVLSHAVFQIVYQIIAPLGRDAFAAINLVSCVSGAAALWLVLRFNRDCVKSDPLWSLGLFVSSGLLILSCGHTEYYTLFIASLFLYGYLGCLYTRSSASIVSVGLAYSLALSMHLGILFAAPSIALLPWLKGRLNDYKGLAYGLLPAAALLLFREIHDVLGVPIQGLSPATNFVPFVIDDSSAQFYTMFSWGHLADILYAWGRRSWIFWPFILICAAMFGVSSLRRADRLFLLVFTVCFTGLALVWHPNLGIEQDWNLFAIEAAPALLLAMTYLPDFNASPYRRTMLATALAASFFINYNQVLDEARFGGRGLGAVNIKLSQQIDYSLTLNGHKKETSIPAIREGVYHIRLIDRTHRTTHERYAAVVPGETTVVPIAVGPVGPSINAP